MNLLFWKKKKPADEGSEEDSRDKSDGETAAAESEKDDSAPARPGLFARIRSKLAAARQRSEPSTTADTLPATEAAPKKTSVEASAEDAAKNIAAIKPRKRLLLAAALIAMILLAGGGFAAWKWLLAPAPADTRVQIEALKKQNQEMQAQIEALKKDNPAKPQPAAIVAEDQPPKNKNAALPPGQGVLVISDKDTKASAQALKQAIEEMNAASRSRNANKPAH